MASWFELVSRSDFCNLKVVSETLPTELKLIYKTVATFQFEYGNIFMISKYAMSCFSFVYVVCIHKIVFPNIVDNIYIN